MQLKRRVFLQTGTAGIATLGAVNARAADTATVVVIGAGLAGLYTAMQLVQAGADVIVLEGSNRVGGRAFTDDSSPYKPEFGAEDIGASYARVVSVCDRLGLKMLPAHHPVLPMSNRINGQWVRSDKWASSPVNKMIGDERTVQPAYTGTTFALKHNRLKALDDWLKPEFSDLDVSLFDLMMKSNASDEAIRLANLSCFGNDIQSYSTLAQLQELNCYDFDRSFAAQNKSIPLTRNVAGGTSRLSDAMAASLGDRIRCGKIVRMIDMDNSHADIMCLDGSRYSADFVVAAIPFSLLRRISITPQMPPLQAEAIELLPSGFTSRGFGHIHAKYWEDDGLEPSFFSDDTIKMVWAVPPKSAGDAYRLTVVMTGAAAMQIDLMDEADARAFATREIIRMRPSMAGKFEIFAWYGWGRDPFAQGCRQTFAPGQVARYGELMIKPYMRLHLAGEHTRRLGVGMEAAMESGDRASSEIIAQIL
jgi:monoamine oxidase